MDAETEAIEFWEQNKELPETFRNEPFEFFMGCLLLGDDGAATRALQAYMRDYPGKAEEAAKKIEAERDEFRKKFAEAGVPCII